MTKDIKWSVDHVHSEVAFKVRHLMIAHVKGTFKIFEANIYTTGRDFTTAQIDFWIDASSITTGDEKRDEHLKGADFFDAKTHKQLTFTSSTIGEADEDGNHELWGELTIKGITKNIKLNVQFMGTMDAPFRNEKAGFILAGKINRDDWGLKWNKVIETGDFMISEDVAISCKVELYNTNQKNLTMKLEPTTNTTVAL
ncbi:MAG TPA: YceI family protein [Bacteroidia bacterium]|nr:YceI family protein [Bacteroidia bacterium]